MKLRLRQIAAIYFRVGNTTFGGGDPTIMGLRKELVENRAGLTADQFALSYSLSRATPGTNILAFCAASGWQLRGWPGALIGVTTVAVPSALLAVLVAGAYQAWMANPYGRGAIYGTLAAAVGLMFAGAWFLMRPHVKRGLLARTAIFVIGAFALTWWAGFSPLQVIGVAAVAGALWREPADS